MCLICFIKEDFRRKDSNKLKTFRYAHNRKRKTAKHWILVGKMNTCNRTAELLAGGDLPPTCSSSCSSSSSSNSSNSTCCSRSMQQQKAAGETSSSKHQHPALLGTRWNQRHHNEKIALMFLLLSSSATKQNKNEGKKHQTNLSFQFLRPPTCILHAVAPCHRLTQTDLSFCRLRISITTTPAA